MHYKLYIPDAVVFQEIIDLLKSHSISIALADEKRRLISVELSDSDCENYINCLSPWNELENRGIIPQPEAVFYQ